MSAYTLMARGGGVMITEDIDAFDDGEAMMAAIFTVLDRASDGSIGEDTWRYGEITLVDPLGNVVATMEPKSVAT